MVSFSIGKLKISLDFSFFAVVGLFFALDSSGYGIFCISACFCHELGHLAALLIKGKVPREMIFSGGGICIRQEREEDSVFVLAAGCIVNFVLFFIFYFALERDSMFKLVFAAANLCIGIFNLLPIGELDGKKLLKRFFTAFFSFRTAERAVSVIEVIGWFFSGAAAIFLFASGAVNLTVISIIIYIFALDILLKKR